MRIQYFNRDKGTYTQTLPETCDGVLELPFVDEDGRYTRLLDAVGDREKWTIHAKPNCQIRPVLMDGDTFSFASATTHAVLTNGFACQVITGSGSVFFAVVTDTSVHNEVFLVPLPLDRSVSIGFSSGCDIRSSFPVVGDVHVLLRRTLQGLQVSPTDTGETFVNRMIFPAGSSTMLTVGDVVDVYGIRIVCMGEFAVVYPNAETVRISATLGPYSSRSGSILSDARHDEISNDLIFNRSPRIYMKHETTKFNIDAPPGPERQEEQPLALSIGSSAMMGMSSIMMATMTLQTAMQTNAPITSVLPSIFMSSGMFVGSLVMPVINRKYQDKQHAKKEKNRRDKYIAYLNDTIGKIREAGAQQRQLLEETYPTVDHLGQYVYERNEHLWERMLNHEDFLDLRLGRARIDTDMEINDPGDHFSLDDDVIRDAFDRFRKMDHKIDDAPFMLQLRKIKVLGVFGEHDLRTRYVSSLLMQICIQHSYRELKVVIICPETGADDWEYTRWLPHCWNDEQSFRYWACTQDDIRQLSIVLQNQCFATRVTRQEEETIHTVIVIADKHLSESCRSLVNAMSNLNGYPVSIIAMAETPAELPKECHSVISLKDTGSTLFGDINRLEQAVSLSYDPMLSDQQLRDLAIKLRHTHLAGEEAEGVLPDVLTFFDMMRCGNVTQMNASVRWQTSNPVKSLAAPLGMNRDGSLLQLDIHQNAHGPHGLIAGTTGSGKSELIIAYLLSMAVCYDPLEVGFVLIDYKGGGMSDTLKALPHVVGVIDNLGGRQSIHRAMVSITNELKRRQRIFKEVGEELGIKNLDIHGYQKLYRSGKVDEPLQHLVIVSDEFAELKQQEPDFMDDLVSAARIGRSLGVHLILATQKPAGVVNDQILSNTRFRLCMKVQDRSDSVSMINKPDAAMLTKTGRFYLQVGMDEVFLLGQSAWSGAPTVDKPYYSQETDNSIELLDNLGSTVVKATPPALVNRSEGDEKQVDTIVRYLAETAKAENKVPRQIWLPLLSDERTLEELEARYEPSYDRWKLDPVVGEVDDPVKQSQYPLQLDLTAGNAAIMGNAGSGQEEMVENIIVSLGRHHAPTDVHIYVLDFSMETTRAMLSMPHVGDVMGAGEDEKITNFMRWLEEECARRRMLIANYGGSLEMIRKDGKQSLPNILVIIENMAAFTESYESFEDTIYTLVRDASNFGIYFVITAANTRAVRSKILQAFRQYYCLQMSEEMEYVNLLGKSDGVTPMKRKGSGIYAADGQVLEFQVALTFLESEQNRADALRWLSREIAEQWPDQRQGATRVKVLPEIVSIADLTPDAAAIQLRKIPVGISKTRLEPVCWDVASNPIHLSLFREPPEFPFFECLANMLCARENRSIYMLDAGGILRPEFPAKYKLMRTDDELRDAVNELFSLIVSRWNANKRAQSEKTTVHFEDTVIFISGIVKLTETLKAFAGQAADSKDPLYQIDVKLDELLSRCGNNLGIHVILVGRPAEISQCSIRNWYANIVRSSGLWIGGGITNQMVLSQQVSMREVLPEGAYGYVVRNETAHCVKFLEAQGTVDG